MEKSRNALIKIVLAKRALSADDSLVPGTPDGGCGKPTG
jgi:hypothetical protein